MFGNEHECLSAKTGTKQRISPFEPVLSPIRQGPEKHIKMKESFLETGFGGLPAVPGHRVTFHD